MIIFHFEVEEWKNCDKGGTKTYSWIIKRYEL